MSADIDVLHVRSSSGLYGAEYVLLGLIPALARLDIHSRLLCMDNPNLDRQPLYERARQLHMQADLLSCSGRIDLSTMRELREIMRLHPGAIVHVHDYKSALYAWWARGRRKQAIVATVHGHFATNAKLRAYEHLEAWLMRRFDEVCVVSDEMKPALMKSGIAAERIHLIENGIDTQRFAPTVAPWSRSEWDIPASATVFGTAMRLTEQKNPFGLLDAFAQVLKSLPQAILVIAGDGPLRRDVELHAEDLGITEHLRLLGAREELEHFYPMLDVFVLPSWYEGLPLALLEAMAATTPIVATAVGQIPVVLRNLPVQTVVAGDHVALGNAMVKLAFQGCNEGLRERVVERYSVERMATAYSQLYRSVRTPHGRAVA